MTTSRFWIYENGVLAMLGLTFGLMFFDRLALTFLMPFVAQDLQLDNTQIGLLSSALAITWALSGVFFGTYIDRHFNRKSMLVFLVIMFSLCTILTGLVTTFAILIVVRAIMGLVEGPVLPITQAIMASESSPARRGFNMGVLQNACSSLLGIVAGPLIMVTLANTYGWRISMMIAGIPGIVMAMVLAKYLRKRQSPGQKSHHDSQHVPLRELLADRNILLCVLIACCLVSWLIVLITFAPIYLVKHRALSPTDMGFVMASLGVGSFLWGLIIPALSDRIGRNPALLISITVTMFVPLAMIWFEGTPTALALLVLALYTGAGCLSLIMAVIPSESAPPAHMAAAFGLIMGTGEIVGGVFAPTLSGLAADHFGPQIPFIISASGAAIALALACFIKETRQEGLDHAAIKVLHDIAAEYPNEVPID